MKKIFICLLMLSVLFPVVNVEAEATDLAPNAKSAILIEASTGEILYEKNAHEKFAPASMTKMMSMLIIMENIENGNLKWEENVRVSANASGMGGSQIFLETNEEMTVEDLLKGIAIGSANDATVALGERIAGTEEAFVDLMNKKSKELGLKNTNFKNSHGLDTANHYSSSYDMSLVAKELVKHKKILEFSAIYETYLRTDTEDKFWLVNTNKLVRFYQGVDGLKTGYTEEAGYCLTATISKKNMRLIAVVMGESDSSTRNKEVSGMLDYGYNVYERIVILENNTVVKNQKIERGKVETIDVIPIEEVSILRKKGSNNNEYEYKANINSINSPVKKGEVVGEIQILENGKVINKVEATVINDVDKANIFQLYCRYLKNIFVGSISFK